MDNPTPESQLDEDIEIDEESAENVSGGRALPHNKKEATDRASASERF